jgi:hypothetical protein
MAAPTTIGARLVNDGTLYVNYDNMSTTLADDGFDEVTFTTHKITKTNVFAKEFDEVTISTNFTSGGSIKLNGTSQKISISGTTDFEFGDHDFTMEGWYYLNDNTKYTRLWCFPDGDNLETQNGELYYWNGGANIISGGTGTVPQSAWFHVALVKYQNQVKVYINGVSVISDSNPFKSASSRPLVLGGETTVLGESNSATAGWLDGYITNFRIVKGAALYLSDFNTPYAPFNVIDHDSTVLLLNAVSSGTILVDSSVKTQTITAPGATWDVATPLSTVYNGAMKQLKNGTLRVGNEFDETTVLS